MWYDAPRRDEDAHVMPADFNLVFAKLRDVLAKHSARLTVAEDSPTRYCLEGGVHPKHKKPMPIAWVEIGKSYVGYHLMPVYGNPKLLDNYSKELRGGMQGKSCFNFKTVDEELFAELDDLTGESFTAFRKDGYLPPK
jgi:hypothetical protein